MNALLLKAFTETCLMVGISGLIAMAGGIPLAIVLDLTRQDGLKPCRAVHHSVGFLVNSIRSIPYIILTVLMIPLTRILAGSSIGTWAAIVPLSLSGILLVARSAEEALRQVPIGVIEVGKAAGAKSTQIVWTVILPEALPGIIAGCVTVLINIVGFSAMAGVVGGGGLGDLAIRYGYQRYDLQLVIIIVMILIVMVQVIQEIGSVLIKRLTK